MWIGQVCRIPGKNLGDAWDPFWDDTSAWIRAVDDFGWQAYAWDDDSWWTSGWNEDAWAYEQALTSQPPASQQATSSDTSKPSTGTPDSHANFSRQGVRCDGR